MRSVLLFTCAVLASVALPCAGQGQDATAPAKPTEHLVGTIASADAAGQTVTLKEDGSGLEHVIQLQNTRTLLKVSPGAKDLKAATRITPSDLAPGDRIDVRGSRVESDPNAIVARSVVLMSSRDLQQAHQNEASAWQHSTGGTVSAIDPSNKSITVNARSAEGPRAIVVNTTAATFTRYSPEHPKIANPSQFSDLQPGDQVKIIGTKNAEGTAIAAQKVFSGTFKSIAGTVTSIAPDGKSLVMKDLATKGAVTIALSDDSTIHKLPPMVATMLARRFNPDMKNAAPAPNASGSGSPREGGAGSPAPDPQASDDTAAGPGARTAQRNPDKGSVGQPGTAAAPDDGGMAGAGRPGGGPGGGPSGAHGGRMANGDLSQMLDRLPKITAADLKAGDAVIVSGSPSASNKSTLLASSVIAGVEPIFQSAPGRQAQSLGDWGASLGGGAAMDTGAPPQ